MSTTNKSNIVLAEKANQLNFDRLIEFETEFNNSEDIANSLLSLYFELTEYILYDESNSGVNRIRNENIYCLRALYECVKYMNDTSNVKFKIIAR